MNYYRHRILRDGMGDLLRARTEAGRLTQGERPTLTADDAAVAAEVRRLSPSWPHFLRSMFAGRDDHYVAVAARYVFREAAEKAGAA